MMKIFDILPIGEENAIPAKQLAAQLGLSERECRARVSKELQEGAFCLSSMHRPGGYFRPSEGEKGRNELIRFYCRELARSRSSPANMKLYMAQIFCNHAAGLYQLLPAILLSRST